MKRLEKKRGMPRKCPRCNGGNLYLSKDAIYVGDNTGNDAVGVFCGSCDCIGTITIRVTTKR